MSVLTFELTSEMDQYADDIKAFVELMVFKLHKNIHKGRWENMTAVQAYFLLQEECTELEQALRSNDWDNTYLECADVANFALIVASIIRESKGDTDV